MVEALAERDFQLKEEPQSVRRQTKEDYTMKSSILALLTSTMVLLIVGCGDESTSISEPSEQIRVLTEKTSYAASDTIRLFLTNNSRSSINVGMRCGLYLEMFYQKKEGQNWGDSLWFAYMSLRCMTVLDSVAMNASFAHSLPAAIFYSTGTFRLRVKVHLPKTSVSLSVFSNPFDIH